MNRPLITIGIPAFKGKYFKDALLCWKRQTYSDFEVYVQDDASPDPLKEIFEEVCVGDARFHYERNEVNTSPNFVDNWHKTLEKANGEYFVLGSDDDLYEDDFLEKMVSLAEKYITVDFFNARHDIFDARGIVILPPRCPEYQTQIEWIYSLVFSPRYIVAQSAMCRTKALKDIGGFDNLPAAWGACDWITWSRMAKNGAVTSDQVLMHWRNDGGNTSSTMSSYWAQQKVLALEMSRERWRLLSESLLPSGKYDEYMVRRIKRRTGAEFFSWLGIYTYSLLPLRDFVKVVKAYLRRGEMTAKHAIFLVLVKIFKTIKGI